MLLNFFPTFNVFAHLAMCLLALEAALVVRLSLFEAHFSLGSNISYHLPRFNYLTFVCEKCISALMEGVHHSNYVILPM